MFMSHDQYHNNIWYCILGGKVKKQTSDGRDDTGNDSVKQSNDGEGLWESLKKFAG